MTANGKNLFQASLEVTLSRLTELSEGLVLGSNRFYPDSTEEELAEVARGFATACELAASAARIARSTDELTETEKSWLAAEEVAKVLARN